MENMPKTNNIEPARRVSQVKEYYFSRKLKEIAQLNAEGANIISLGVGGPDRPPHDSVVSTLCNEATKADAHGYQSYTGLPALRKAYAAWYGKFYSVVLNPDNEVLPLIGSKEGILHTTLAFVNPGDGVLVPNPGYPTYTSVSRLAEADVHYYDLTEENGWEPDFEALEKMPLDGVKLMWVNYPHMPTGKTANLQLFERLIDFGKHHNIVIVNDNPYSFILNDKPLSILQMEGARDIAIEMNSLSKSHNMPGWRMGMLASNSTFVQWILKVKSNIDTGQYKPMMLAAAQALSCDEEWFADLNGEYAQRRAIAEQIVKELGCTFDPAQRGLFLWAKVPERHNDGEQLADRVLDEARVFIVPGFIFGSNGKYFVRLSLCATQAMLNEALQRIKLMNK
ncbi:MAG: aminotransferase class I/II-fold pyridoxal phosphate-dependent enzyme [Muribaculaceae bacterium]|nr:aminotransferase class I/II-fold pyridoxal phosphate-dependent enzyme [Muribaculaceae bacterium]